MSHDNAINALLEERNRRAAEFRAVAPNCDFGYANVTSTAIAALDSAIDIVCRTCGVPVPEKTSPTAPRPGVEHVCTKACLRFEEGLGRKWSYCAITAAAKRLEESP